VSVKKRSRRGKVVLVVDLQFVGANGPERYRRDARLQTKAGAEAEERKVLQYFALNDTIAGLLNPEQATQTKVKKLYTWEDAVQHYKEREFLSLAESTRRGYQGVLDSPSMRSWAGVKVRDIQYDQLLRYQTALSGDHSPATVHQHRSVMMQILKSVGPHGPQPGAMLDHLPQFPDKVSIGKQGFELPTDEQIADLFAEVAEKGSYLNPKKLKRVHLACALAAHAGLRASEVRALQISDVDMKKRIITVRRAECYGKTESTKSGDERRVPIHHPRLVRLLKERLAEMKPSEVHVSVRGSGTGWGQFGLRDAYKRACKRLRLPLSRFHGLRHYHCTDLIRRGVALSTVREIMGHSSLMVTDRYAHHVKGESGLAELAQLFSADEDDAAE